MGAIMNLILLTILGCVSSNTSDVVVNEKEIFQDSDNDGFSSDEDCDDSQPTVFPGATELCNGILDNCNTTTGLMNGIPSNEYDADLDGYVERLVCPETVNTIRTSTG